MAFGKKNHVKVDPTAYSFMLLGEPKIGKTTVLKEAAEKLVGEDGYLFVELGRERGADAIENITHINCPEYHMDYDEETNSVGWDDLVCDIEENKSTEYPDLKLILMDTYDQYINISQTESLRLYNKDNPDKRAKTLNGAWGGFGAGDKKTIEIMFDYIDRLNAVGVKVWWVGHVRNKAVTDITTGDSYEVLSSDQQQNYFNALKKNLHFLGLAYVDRQIVKEKTGRKNAVTKKEEEKAVVKEESRKIKFRDDSFVIDCGSRFKDIVDEVDLDADQLIEAMTNAIKAEVAKGSTSYEDSKKAEEKAEAAKMKEIAKAEKAKKVQKSVDDIMAKVLDYIKANKSNAAAYAPIVAKCKEAGVKPTEVTDIELAKELLAMIEE